MSSRDIKDEEKAQARDNGVQINTITVAKDAIALIVNENNPLDELSIEQIRLIFTGIIRDWAAIGGRPGEISAYTRNTASGNYNVFQELGMEDEDYSNLTQKMAGNEQIAAEVATNRNGIGYVGLAYIDTPGIKVVKVNGFKPTPESVTGGYYPIARALYYLTGSELSPVASDFIGFTLGQEGQRIVAEVDFVPVGGVAGSGDLHESRVI
jgi:phosphate transport system substrate-binding protein